MLPKRVRISGRSVRLTQRARNAVQRDLDMEKRRTTLRRVGAQKKRRVTTSEPKMLTEVKPIATETHRTAVPESKIKEFRRMLVNAPFRGKLNAMFERMNTDMDYKHKALDAFELLKRSREKLSKLEHQKDRSAEAQRYLAGQESARAITELEKLSGEV